MPSSENAALPGTHLPGLNERCLEDFFAPRGCSLTIACIVSRRIYDRLHHDADLYFLTPDNYRRVLEYIDVDFVLVESCYASATGDWTCAQFSQNALRDELLNLLDTARAAGIPTAYWHTVASHVSESWKRFVGSFDHIFSAFEDAELPSERTVHYLAESIQPRVHNPFVSAGETRLNYCIATSDPSTTLDLLGPDMVKEHDICFLGATGAGQPATRSGRDDVFRGRLVNLGTITDVANVMTKARAYISIDDATSGSTRRGKALEAAAAGVPVLHLGDLAPTDIRHEFATICRTRRELAHELCQLREPVYRLRAGQRAFRAAHDRHTILHRLDTISRVIETRFDWDEYPLLTVGCATRRLDFIPRVLKCFDNQCYPNKELVVVYNGNDVPPVELVALVSDRENSSFHQVPKDSALGGALNCAVANANGSYFFKFDDDDVYAENYLLDLVLAVRSLNVEIWGKPQTNFFHFDDEPNLRLRKNKRGCFYLTTNQSAETAGKQIVLGNTISARTDFLRANKFPENMPRHTDTMFFTKLGELPETINLAICDPFNMVVERRSDLTSHTWTADKQHLLRTCEGIWSYHDAIV